MRRRAALADPPILTLPPPCRNGQLSLENCLSERRSCRVFEERSLSVPEIGQLLWAAQGITGAAGLRTAPSAKAVYPLRLDVIAAEVEDVAAGVYRYDPEAHRLTLRFRGDLREQLVAAAGGQEVIALAPVVVLMSAVYRGMLREFGERGTRLSHIEAGHIGQNLCLEATSLGLGCLTMGAFDDALFKKLARLGESEEPIYCVAIGHR